MKKAYLFFVLIIIFGINSCENSNQEKFIEEEKLEISEKANLLLTDLGYSNFDIHIYYHKNYNNREVSKSVSTYKIYGDRIPINVINYSDFSYRIDADFQEEITNGYIESRQMTVNYDELGGGKIFYEYISIVIIMDNIEQRECNELMKIFSNYILNNNRGDTIYIKGK
ncbi:MAG: hypothetical protein LBK08_05145 [Treponema sp.]|jgi:hypothetical protein|nr:hypothetical protein [Treponema sp.]